MSDLDKEIANKVESGEYFVEGLKWYNFIFVKPQCDLATVSIITLVAVISFFTYFIAFTELFPLSPGKGFAVFRPIKDNEFLKLLPLKEGKEGSDESIIKFMVSEYLKSRREYVEERIDRNFRIVTALSGDNVYNEFLSETSLDNPNNPVILYGKQARRTVYIQSIKFLYPAKKNGEKIDLDKHMKGLDKILPNKAVVEYAEVLDIIADNSQQITRYKADIAFQYKQIIVDQDTGKLEKSPEIVITEFKTKAL